MKSFLTCPSVSTDGHLWFPGIAFRLDRRKSRYYASFTLFWPHRYDREDLGEVGDYPCPLSAILKAFEDNGVRVDKADLLDQDVAHRDKNVVVVRGFSACVLYCAYKCLSHGLTGKKVGDGGPEINVQKIVIGLDGNGDVDAFVVHGGHASNTHDRQVVNEGVDA